MAKAVKEQIAVIKKNPATGRFEMHLNGKVICRSKDREYFEYHHKRQDATKLIGLKVDRWVYADSALTAQVQSEDNSPVTSFSSIEEIKTIDSLFTINERFEMMDEMLDMTIRGSQKGMIIGGEGGIGKSFAVQKRLDSLNMVNTAKAISSMMPDDLEVEDSEENVVEKVMALSKLDSVGDYIIISGNITPPALYKALYENNGKFIIFDDCDKTLNDADCVRLLKAALDTKKERYVWKFTAELFPAIPPVFLFTGQCLFITNMNMNKIDQALMTRCLKVDVAMSKEQRVERMKGTIADVLPVGFAHHEITVEQKLEALAVMEETLQLAKDVSYRMLLQLITIRVDKHVKNWKRLAQFTLLSAQGD